MTVVCGDSHTATHGAFGALAFGIGTSEVEHVLATQCLLQRKSKTYQVRVDGELEAGCSAKDIILNLISRIGIGGGTGCVFEYCGSAIRALSMEERMTVCNMSIEAGARAGLVAPDDTTYKYLNGRPLAPKGADWDAAVARWKQLPTDEGAVYDSSITIDAIALEPMITFGTNPGMGIPITAPIPDPSSISDPIERESLAKALRYMDLQAGQAAAGSSGQCRVYRKLHQFAHVRSARCGGGSEGPQGQPERSRDGGSWLDGNQAPGRSRRARSGLPRSRRRMARSGLLDVHRDERRSVAARRVQRLDQQSQLRRPAGQGRPDIPGQPADRRRKRHHRQV